MSITESIFPLPGVQHGKRIIASVIEARAKKDDDAPWVSLPIDDENMSLGFKDISFRTFNNAANHAAHWLRQNLPETTEPFQKFAYAGPKDLRYPILAVAAAKLQKVLILPSPLVTAEAQRRILESQKCTVYLRPSTMKAQVDAILHDAPHIQTIDIPDLEQFLKVTESEPVTYSKTWDEGKNDPWLVFHTSGTTGNPKPVTWTHRMMASIDMMAAAPNIKDSMVHRAANHRLFTPIPSLHLTGMMLILATTTYVNMTAVLGPSTALTPATVISVFQNAHIDGTLLPPALIDGLCLSEAGLAALRSLSFLMYTGAPLAAKSAALLTPYIPVVINGVGTTEAGGYFATHHEHRDADAYLWLSFAQQKGATFEPRTADGLHELVFVRDDPATIAKNVDLDADDEPVIFQTYPHLTRFETHDLWRPHPVHRDLWQIVGRTDDYVPLSHSDGLHASSLEPEITAHPAVRAALIGGHGRAKPVLLVQLVEGMTASEFEVESLRPYVDKVNARVHECVRLEMGRVIVASEEKPFLYTAKQSVARMQSLGLYEAEIEALEE
ncbi:AMP-binding enzyme [Aspergillus aculeatinus CBS 121060]|uniref:AMP-binding enzyme n=1 Tax=Aspergillus aculeatinus CBS 121060 TaxID=1448322 RepID=A0ACD1GSC4_9EURO|nr:AMP-binding enzyme [Aspergillus aculeatinus CBS 121060]RAH64234.1 AMP-binding enzyme [Aspergillus aculeatinus CBS 121060]